MVCSMCSREQKVWKVAGKFKFTKSVYPRGVSKKNFPNLKLGMGFFYNLKLDSKKSKNYAHLFVNY